MDGAEVGAVLLSALGDRYAVEHQESALHEFEQSGATYLFDLASAARVVDEEAPPQGHDRPCDERQTVFRAISLAACRAASRRGQRR